LKTMFESRNDYSVWKWCRQPSLISNVSHKAWYEWQAKDPNTKMFVIKAPMMDVAGVCGLTSIDWVNRRAEFSLYITPYCRRKGHATAALKTLFSHGFSDLNMHSIWGETFEGNPALDIFINAGMVFEGVRRDFYFKDGKYLDAHMISVKETEWKSQSRS